MRVFIVDNEVEVCRHLQHELRKEGYDVKYNTSSVGVLEELKHAADEGKAYDLLLLNIKMPKINGYSLMEKIRETQLDLDVIVITGYGDEDKAIESIRLGAVDYLRKPISLKEFHTAIFRAQQKKAEKENRTLEPRILIVDDEEDLCVRIKRVLEKKGYQAAIAYDGVEGWDYFKNNRVDMAIVDIRMPKMSGLEMLKKCQEISDDFVSIIITGHGNHEKAIEALKLGALNYLRKPVSLEELIVSVKKGIELLTFRRGLSARRRELEIETALKEQYAKNLEKIVDERIKELRREKKFSENIIATMPACLLIVDKDLRIKSANRAFYEIFQAEAGSKEMIGSRITDVLGGGDGGSSNELIKLFGIEDRVKSFELYYQSGKPGERIFNITTGGMFFAEAEELVILQDITERKKAEQELRDAYQKLKATHQQLIQSSKMAAMGQLAAGISHELNQPLTGVKGFAQAALLDLKEDSSIRSDLNKILKQADRMNAIIKNVHSFAKKSEFKIAEIDINKPIADSFILLAEQLKMHNIRVNKSLTSNLPPIQADHNQLQQVFINLITNARDAIDSKKDPQGGRIIIETCLSRDKKRIEIIFQDTGEGISQENIEHIFNPFFTTKSPNRGMGLGLSIVHRIIEEHKGTIAIESKDGEGMRFKITLPVAVRG